MKLPASEDSDRQVTELLRVLSRCLHVNHNIPSLLCPSFFVNDLSNTTPAYYPFKRSTDYEISLSQALNGITINILMLAGRRGNVTRSHICIYHVFVCGWEILQTIRLRLGKTLRMLVEL